MKIPLPPQRFWRDAERLAPYAADEAARGKLPSAVAFPVNAQEVASLMGYAAASGLAVVPRGAGSGLSGGAIPLSDTLIISLEKLDQHLHIDPSAMTAQADAGVITGAIRTAAAEHGLRYAPIPASVDFCTIGGNVATNAGGLCAVKYGVTRQHVLGLQVVLPTGEIIQTGGVLHKNSTGYDLTQLVCGSEGTLGIVTRVTLRLLVAPAAQRSMLVPFPAIEALTAGVLRVLEGTPLPQTMEFLPRSAVECVLARHPDYTFPFREAAACLLIEVDGDSVEDVMEQLTTIAEKLRAAGSEEGIVATTEAQREELWTIRKQCRDSIANSGEYVEADSVVPRARLPELAAAAQAAAELADLEVISYGHAGDGNLHTYFLRGELDDAQWEKRSQEALRSFFETTTALGGTISGEHGIGYTKREYLPLALAPEQIALMRRIKTAFDPEGILNPHKVFPD